MQITFLNLVKGGGGGHNSLIPFGRQTAAPLLLISALSVLFIGCQPSSPPKPPGMPDTVACVITITQDSQPLADASVALVPTDGKTDWLAAGTTDTTGNAKIYTYGQAEGAPLGKYKVVVTKIENEPSKFTMPDPADGVAMSAYQQNTANEKLKSWSLVAPQYASAATSPLELEVTGKTAQTFDIGKAVRDLQPAMP